MVRLQSSGIIKICIISIILQGIIHFSYGQKPMFEFGQKQSLESITSEAIAESGSIKWYDVNITDITWSLKDDILICFGLPIGVARSENQYENFD